jgi:signal peptidase
MFSKILYYTLVTTAFALVLLLVMVQTSLIPGYQARIVQSGSMEPAITTGSLVVTQQEEQYSVDDVITFTTDGSDIPTTHRIMSDGLQQGELVYYTKGDANNESDIEPVTPGQILGRVILSIPYLGYLLDFARQPLGFVLLIGVPALMIFVEEAGSIVREFRNRKKEQSDE